MSNRFYLGTIAVLVIVILSLWTCNGCLKGKIAKLENQPAGEVVKTVTKTDTSYVKEVVDVPVYVPKPYVIIKSRVDSFTAFELQHVDTGAILNDYFASVVYKDSAQLQYGKIFINDTISRNRIAGRSLHTDFTIPIVTNTITNTVAEKKRNQVYLGINAQGSQADYLTAFGPSLMFKTKTDKAFEIGALYNKSNAWLFTAGIKFKISFTKN